MIQLLKSVNPLAWLIAGAILFVAGIALAIRFISLEKRERQRTKAELHRLFLSNQAPRVKAYCSSIIGNRGSQQDFVSLPDANTPEQLTASKGMLVTVCDGMGGMQGGEKASRCCALLLRDNFYSKDYRSPADFYKTVIPMADEAVCSLKGPDGEPLGGGTTLVSAIIKGRHAYTASVGDSRIYLYRNGYLSQLTRDHNYMLTLSQRVRAGLITLEDAMSDPQREALISYVGMGSTPDIIDIDSEGFAVNAGDMIILCSDGLYKALSAQEIQALAASHSASPEALPEALTTAAFSKSWIRHDNITVAVISCVSPT